MSDSAAQLLKGGRIVIASLLALAFVLLLGRGLSSFYVDVLWFRSVGYSSVFWTRTLWGWGVRALVFVVSWALISYNLGLVARTMGGIQIRRSFGNLEIQEQLPRKYVRWTVLGVGLLMGLWIGATVPLDAGVGFLALIRAPQWGLSDPILGRDASFYVFAIPALIRVLAFGILMTFLLLSLTGAGYVTTGAMKVVRGRLVLQPLARTHLAALGAVFLALMAARFWLSRYTLLLDGTSAVEGIFGYTDARARLPALQFLTVMSLAGAGAVFWGGWKGRMSTLMAGLAGVVVSVLVVGQFYPSFVQRFQVEPNELDRETPYIEHALEFTRLGFGLQDLDRRQFSYRRPASSDWAEAAGQMAGLPVWTPEALLGTFRQLEARFRYYDFSTVAIDRYRDPSGDLVPVAISAREVDPSGIEDPNWQNLHLRERFISGMGVVATDAAGATPEGRTPFYIRSIPPEDVGGRATPPELELQRPSLFFGSRPQLYAIFSPSEERFVSPDSTPGQEGVDFPVGIRMASTLRTLALAWRFQDANLLFASEVNAGSRFVFRRQVVERVRAIAPFLLFPETPYAVIHEGRVIWVLEGLTATRNFPLSTTRDIGVRRAVNYVRGSVKVTVDAVTGEMKLYVVDESDPLLDTYRRVFPDLLLPLSEMPAGLLEHVRYPRTLLELQSEVLTQYHLETAPLFHAQQDVWNLAQEMGRGTTPVAYRPEYGIYRLPGEEDREFLLSTVFVPAGRQNLTGILVARSNPDRYGELVLYEVPVEDQVPGPRQVEALVEQDPAISQQFSLWRQGGSQVWSGHLHLVPVGGTLLYLEPIFLAAEDDAIPELRRFVVSDGERVAMTPTLAEALAQLAPGGVEIQGVPGGTEAAADLGAGAVPGAALGLDPSGWPREALDLLDEAEARLREGDWEGFGAALERLRRFLEARGGADVS